MRELWVELIKQLIRSYQFDMDVMSQPWMYWALLIPITFYVVFFLIKWSVITAPVWLPIVIILRAWKVGR